MAWRGVVWCGHSHKNLSYPQLVVQVYDSANPSEKAETKLFITVKRNVNVPKFKKDSYVATLAENFPLGEPVLTVEADDRDGDEVRYSIMAAESVKRFFFMNPLNGQLSVAKPLTESSAKQYVVSDCFVKEEVLLVWWTAAAWEGNAAMNTEINSRTCI